mgnify:CR=1 FL=1
MAIKVSKSRKLFLLVNMFLLIVACLLTFLPFMHVIAQSLSDSVAIDSGKVTILPVNFTLDNYKYVFQDVSIWQIGRASCRERV